MNKKWLEIKYVCNNPNCKFSTVFIITNIDHIKLPDTDCPECGWHDSVIEDYKELN
jgi:hypothetical protein